VSDIDLAVLDQDETWTDAAGTVHRISDMEARYCRNVIAFLRRRAEEIAFVRGETLCDVRLPDQDTHAYDAVAASLDEELRRLATDPVGWLNARPLIKALQQQADKGD
jgi:uncharacterized protein YaeQ